MGLYVKGRLDQIKNFSVRRCLNIIVWFMD